LRARAGFGAAAAASEWSARNTPFAMSRLCVILFGPPGSGKGTQAKFLKVALGMAHISTGDMLREHIAAGGGLGREVEATIQAGGLVPDELVNRMVEDRIERADCETGFILD